MTETLRQPTLATLGLGDTIDIFRAGRMLVSASDLVDVIFGPADDRGSLVISGANGIVGSGKTMQLGSRLEPYGVRVVALDLPSAPDGIGRQYQGLVRAFGREGADAVMQNVVRLTYDGSSLPAELDRMNPRFLLEAIPEILSLKRAHYSMFRERFPEIEIRSVTSGFPAGELGVGVAHPAFPHEINKIWETIEDEPSDITRLLWALGLTPMPMADHWSFVLDVLFCGITLAGLRYHDVSNMPYWKLDKFVRKLVGPNPFRAHDAIGAKGADYLTWSCLHHLGEHYGGLFTPNAALTERKDTGQEWYPGNHFRPLVDWSLDEASEEELRTWLLGPIYQMTALMVHEKRAHLSLMNSIGEVCAQFRRGVLAMMREDGADAVRTTVEAYQKAFPGAAETAWHPEVLDAIESPEWQQLYVNAECRGDVGLVTIGRESYNRDVDAELNRALDWLLAAGVKRVILSGDFHLSTQLVGADTSEFFPALENSEDGFRISSDWSRTARRLHDEFEASVGFLSGKRCLGGMLELMTHCHYLIATEEVALGFPEVTLPVVPGMEGCHWPVRKAAPDDRRRIYEMLLGGRSVAARDAVGWLVDVAAPLDEALDVAWKIALGKDHGVALRSVDEEPIEGLEVEVPGLVEGSEATEAARRAIAECVRAACEVALAEAVDVQANHSAGFMLTKHCRRGRVGSEHQRTMMV